MNQGEREAKMNTIIIRRGDLIAYLNILEEEAAKIKTRIRILGEELTRMYAEEDKQDDIDYEAEADGDGDMRRQQ